MSKDFSIRYRLTIDHDEPGDGFGYGVLNIAGEGREFRIASRPRPEEHREGVGSLPNEREVSAETVFDLLARTWSVGGCLRNRFTKFLSDLSQELYKEVSLGAEMLVKHWLRDSGGFGYVVH